MAPPKAAKTMKAMKCSKPSVQCRSAEIKPDWPAIALSTQPRCLACAIGFAAVIIGFLLAGGRWSGSSANGRDLFLPSTWASLDSATRAQLYVTSAAVGSLGEDLTSCAKVIQPAEFQYGNERVRGAAASTNLSPSVFCTIGRGALVNVATMRSMLKRTFSNQPTMAREISSIESLVQTPADERSLLVVLIMREASRTWSPLMPYIKALLGHAHEHIPSAWDSSSADGAARRATLRQTDGPLVLKAADELRKVVAEHYTAVVPRALKRMPQLLLDGVEAPDEYYSLQRFTEVWLSIRSRSFDNDGYGSLVPLACLMNHPSEGHDSNVELRYNAQRQGFEMLATRHIERGEQLTYSYGSGICRERALLVYGFVQEGMPSCFDG